MKIVRIFHDQLQFNKLPAVFALDLTFKQIRKYSLENMYDIMASASENGRYFLINETKKDKIAFGTFGVVYKVDNISMGNIAAIKESRIDYNPDNGNFEFMIYDAYHDVKTEFSNLHMLYNIKLIANIQPPPYFSYKTESNYKQFCHVGYYFNIGDLYEASNMISFNLRLESFSHGFTALIYALYELHKQDLFHNDIKPENIFTEIDSNDVYQLCFGDMGSIRQATDMNEEFQIHEHTPIFTPFNPKALTFDCKQLKSVDVYQLGASFYNILTGNPPYLKDAETDDYPDFSLEFYTDILLETCSPEAILLLQRMCDPNQSSRYTIIDCVNHIEKSDFKWEKGK